MATDSQGATIQAGDTVTITCTVSVCDPNANYPDLIVQPVIPATSAGDKQSIPVNSAQVTRITP